VSSKQAKKKKHDLAERSGGDIVDVSSQERARSTAIIQKYKKFINFHHGHRRLIWDSPSLLLCLLSSTSPNNALAESRQEENVQGNQIATDM
jgi:hypothetical protein